MANLITLARLALLFVLVALAYGAPAHVQLANPPLLLLIVGLDGLDGWVARRRGECSRFGAIFDIAADRVVEYVLWIVLADLGLAPLWVALLFVVRGTVVDAIRYGAVLEGESPFGMMRSGWGRALVAGRFMRGLYGVLKAATFAWLLLLQPLPAAAPALWAEWGGMAGVVGQALVLASVLVCLLRGLPVVAEFAAGEIVASGRRDSRTGTRA